MEGASSLRNIDTTYPREGTETVLHRLSRATSDIDTTYPREGTETPISCAAGRATGHNLSPRGDGNPWCRNSGKWSTTQLIPARGRKLPAIIIYGIVDQTQLIPARGRKPYPWGLGISNWGMTQLIPARGRKPMPDSYRGHTTDTTYPREGTETIACSVRAKFPQDTTYPREGTETWAGARGTTTTARHNLSPRGDGNSIPRTIILNVSRHNLSPRGDGNNHFYSPSRFEKDTTYPREGTETGLFRPEI